MQTHDFVYNPPFLIFYLLTDYQEYDKKAKPQEFGEYNKILKVPFTFELTQMYEQLNGNNISLQEPILFLDKKCILNTLEII